MASEFSSSKFTNLKPSVSDSLESSEERRRKLLALHTFFDTSGEAVADTVAALPEAVRSMVNELIEQEISRSEPDSFREAPKPELPDLPYPVDSLELEDIFDLQTIQRIQDQFAWATGVASIITRPDGTPYTNPSNFCRLCQEIIRKTEKGCANCFKSDAALGKLRNDGPTIQPCLSGGLWDAGAAISVGGRHIANWLIGQVRNETQSVERIRDYALEIGADPDEAARAFLEVTPMNVERFTAISELLFTMANHISALAYQNRCLTNSMKSLSQAKESLAHSEAKFRSYIQSSPFGVFVTDLSGRYLEVNRAAEVITGYQAEDILEMTIRDFIHPDDMTMALEHFNRLVQGGRSSGDMRFVRRDGSVGHWTVDAVRLSENRCLGFVQDITAQVKTKEQLLQSQKMDAVGRLAGGVAHDFNNMLGVITGCVELCLEAADPQWPILDSLTDIKKAAEHSADLTRQLLTFARSQSNRPEVVDLNEVISSQLTMLRRLISEEIELVWTPCPELWNIFMDPTQIAQILANLCINARDAISGHGRITIETANSTIDQEYCELNPGFKPGDFVAISLGDSGHGMDKKTLSSIFEPFFTTKKRGMGTGLGLATVYGIIRQNNGTVNVYSEPDHGTVFRIYFPRHRGAEKSESSKAIISSKVTRGTETVLMVEDESALLQLGQRILSKIGYKVLAAADPGDALRAAMEHNGRIHLLISDVILPGMKGPEMAEKLLRLHPQMKILFMSGYSENYLVAQGSLQEGSNCIQKPFSIHELGIRVREILDSDI